MNVIETRWICNEGGSHSSKEEFGKEERERDQKEGVRKKKQGNMEKKFDRLVIPCDKM